MADRIVLIRHSSALRSISEQEALGTLDEADLKLPRHVIHIDTTPFSDDVEAGDWEQSLAYLHERARAIRDAANEAPGTVRLRYLGLAEMPHVITVGALVGDERFVELIDFDRHGKEWRWPAGDGPLTLSADPLPRERLTQSGIAVVRVGISGLIQDSEVEAAVGREALADVTISPVGVSPRVGLVRSPSDVEEVRRACREALSAIAAARPGVDVIHLFVAAPVSACFVIGQELHLRSSVPVQTYRFRKVEGETSWVEAIRLSGSIAEQLAPSLSAEELQAAARARDIWAGALADVQRYAAARRQEPMHPLKRWYGTPRLADAFQGADPFPALPAIWDVVDARDKMDPQPFSGAADGYRLDKDNRRWQLDDRLLAGLAAACGDELELRRLIRLFLFHEYLHEYNALNEYTARDVGSFANCLEHLDYSADLYAVVHELDRTMLVEAGPSPTLMDPAALVADLVDLILRSFRAFDRSLRDEWQVRRVRRYLNWYWRHVQVKRAGPDLAWVMATLATAPAIELAGVRLGIRRRRVIANLAKPMAGEHVAMALVLEDERLMRVTDSVVTNLSEFLKAFRTGDHAAVKEFFNAVYGEAAQRHGALPPRPSGGAGAQR
jgi:hypothetical protein